MKEFRQAILPFATLLIIILYTYAYFGKMPYLGFYYTYLNEVTDVYAEGGDEILNHELIEVNGEDWSDLREKIFQPFLADVQPGDTLRLTLAMDGEIKEVDWVVPTDQTVEYLARLQGVWWLPFMFWFAGMFTWYMLRPRNSNWLLLVSFNMLVALYIAALRGPSLSNIFLSASLVRFVGCMVLPVFWHLHWNFPKPLATMPPSLTIGLYVVTGVIALLSGANVLPEVIFHIFSFSALLGSVVIMIVKWVLQRESRRETLFVLMIFFVVFAPPALTTVAYSYFDFHIDIVRFSNAYVLLPALPGGYFLIAFQSQMYSEKLMRRVRRLYLLIVFLCNIAVGVMLASLISIDWRHSYGAVMVVTGLAASGSMAVVLAPVFGVLGTPFRARSSQENILVSIGPRPNPILIPYLFLTASGLVVFLALLTLNAPLALSLRDMQVIALTGFIVAVLTLLLYPGFRRVVERYVFNMVLPTNELTESFSRQITMTLNLQDLAGLMTRVILPSMLIRRSALYFINNFGRFVALFNYGVEEQAVPDHGLILRELSYSNSTSAILVRASAPRRFPSWVRVAYPLRMRGKAIGYWLLGEHDPDDEYSPYDISLIHLLGSQVAIAISNILATAQLHNYYQADIDREEADRVEVARGLHDQVLNQLASLSMLIEADASKEEMLASYEKTKANLRGLISRLRPQVLDFGLAHALHELSTQLMSTYTDTEMVVDLPYASPRYEPAVENHVYSIMQHVCENAFLHANAEKIVIRGEMDEDRIHLSIVDDGVGFDFESTSFTRLIEEKHFGLVGIYERADLINAVVVVNSAPGMGTSVDLHWEKRQHA